MGLFDRLARQTKRIASREKIKRARMPSSSDSGSGRDNGNLERKFRTWFAKRQIERYLEKRKKEREKEKIVNKFTAKNLTKKTLLPVANTLFGGKEHAPTLFDRKKFPDGRDPTTYGDQPHDYLYEPPTNKQIKKEKKASEKFANKHPFLHGLEDGFNPFGSEKTSYDYLMKQRGIKDTYDDRKAKKSGYYTAGHVAGEIAQSAPILAAGSTGKIGAKVVGKLGGKKLLKKVLKKKVGRLAVRSIGDAVVSAPINLSQATNESKNVSEIPKKFAENTALDVAFGGALELGGKGIKKGIEKGREFATKIHADKIAKSVTKKPGTVEKAFKELGGKIKIATDDKGVVNLKKKADTIYQKIVKSRPDSSESLLDDVATGGNKSRKIPRLDAPKGKIDVGLLGNGKKLGKLDDDIANFPNVKKRKLSQAHTGAKSDKVIEDIGEAKKASQRLDSEATGDLIDTIQPQKAKTLKQIGQTVNNVPKKSEITTKLAKIDSSKDTLNKLRDYRAGFEVENISSIRKIDKAIKNNNLSVKQVRTLAEGKTEKEIGEMLTDTGGIKKGYREEILKYSSFDTPRLREQVKKAENFVQGSDVNVSQIEKLNIPNSENVSQATHKLLARNKMSLQGKKYVVADLMDNTAHFRKQDRQAIASQIQSVEKMFGDEHKIKSFTEKIAQRNAENTPLTYDELVEAKVLLSKAKNQGVPEVERELSEAMVRTASESGAMMRLWREIVKASPEGQILGIKKIAKKMEHTYFKRLKGKKLVVSEDIIKKFHEANTNEAKKKALNDLYVDLWKQVPASLTEKIDSLRYTAMLFSIPTHERNIIGNGLNYIVEGIRDDIQSIPEAILRKAGLIDERTTTLLPATRKQKAYVKNLWKENKDLIMGGTQKFSERLRPHEAPVFSTKNPVGKAFNLINKTNFDLLEAEDRIAIGLNFNRTVSKYLKVNKIDPSEITNELKDYLIDYGQKRAKSATFRTEREVFDALSNLRDKNQGIDFLISSVTPFVKTPTNIVAKGVEFSPLNLINGTFEFTKGLLKGQGNTIAKGVKDISSGIVGTAIGIGGYLAYTKGLLTPSLGFEGAEQFKRDEGYSDYSLIFNDPKTGEKLNVDISSFAPLTMPLFLGGELGKMAENGEISTAGAVELIAKACSPYEDMSLLQGVKNVTKSFANEKTGVPGAIATAGTNYISQFAPSALRQLAYTIDEHFRQPMSTKESAFQRQLENQLLSGTIGKMPILKDTKLEPRLDNYGRPVKQMIEGKDLENVGARFLYNFFSPVHVNKIKNTPVDKELTRLINAVPSDKISAITLPYIKGAVEITKKDVNMKLNAKQITEMKKERGAFALKQLEKLFKKKDYINASDEEKADKVAYINKLAVQEGKIKALIKAGKKELDARMLFMTKADALAAENLRKMRGSDLKDFYKVQEKMELLKKDIGNSDSLRAMVIMTGDSKQKERLYQAYTIKKEDISRVKMYLGEGGNLEELTFARKKGKQKIDKYGISSEEGRTYRALQHIGIAENVKHDRALYFFDVGRKVGTIRNIVKHKVKDKDVIDVTKNTDLDNSGRVSVAEAVKYIETHHKELPQTHKSLLARLVIPWNARNPYGDIEYDRSMNRKGGGRRKGRRRGRGRKGGKGGAGGIHIDPNMFDKYNTHAPSQMDGIFDPKALDIKPVKYPTEILGRQPKPVELPKTLLQDDTLTAKQRIAIAKKYSQYYKPKR